MARFIWDKRARNGRGDFVPAEEYRSGFTGGGVQLISDIQPFVSPIDGKEVGSRSALRAHNKTHDVVDRREFKGHQFKKPDLPPVRPDVVAAFKQVMGKL